MKEALDGKVTEVRLSQRLKSHPVCLSSSGPLSIEMEKVLNSMPAQQEKVKSEKVLELNGEHEVFAALKRLFEAGDKEKLAAYSEILYDQALLIEGLALEDPVAYANNVCKLMVCFSQTAFTEKSRARRKLLRRARFFSLCGRYFSSVRPRI